MKLEKKQACVIVVFLGLILSGIFICLCLSGTVAHAAGLVDDVINPEHLYSKYGLQNYQLDFYVDNSWAWLPWNWKSGIGKQVMYGIYIITNVLWTLSVYISYGTGYVVQQAYELDFVNDMADKLGASIQTLIGITPHGVTKSGIFYRTLPLILLVMGVYMIYVGLVKHETSKAIQTFLNTTLVCILTMAFVVGAPSYIKMINGLSSDISTAVLDAGSKIMLSGEDKGGGDSVDKMRDNLFSIQILQPWLLLQYGTTDIDTIGKDRVEGLLSEDPDTTNEDNTNAREEVVKDEIANKGNSNLSTASVGSRLAMVFFLLILNGGISVFVFLLTGLMLLSQLLFIMFAVFLVFAFVISMIPGQEGKWKQAAVKTFNTILTRSGIALVTTVAFCLSTLVYSMSKDYPFFMVVFLQIVIFAGTAYKLNDFLVMFSMQSNDSQTLGRRMMRRPYMFMRRQTRRMGRRMERNIMGSISGKQSARKRERYQNNTGRWQLKYDRMAGNRIDTEKESKQEQRANTAFGRAEIKVGAVMDAPERMTDKAKMMEEKVRGIPTNVRYGAYRAKEDFKSEITAEQRERKKGRTSARETYQEDMEHKKSTLQEAAEKRRSSASRRSMVRESDIKTGQGQTGAEKAEIYNEARSPLKKEQMGQKTRQKQTEQKHQKLQEKSNRNKWTKQQLVYQEAAAKNDKTLSERNVIKGSRLSVKENRKTKWNDLGQMPKDAGLNQCVDQRPDIKEWESPQQMLKNPEIRAAKHTPVIQNKRTVYEVNNKNNRRQEEQRTIRASSIESRQMDIKNSGQIKDTRKERK